MMKKFLICLTLLGLGVLLAQNAAAQEFDQIDEATETIATMTGTTLDAAKTRFLGKELYNKNGLIEMTIGFVLNLVMAAVVALGFYYPKSRRKDYLFTFMLFAVSIFMLIYLMEDTKIKTGAALGLFAIFGIIRYRTEQVPIREMTYLFVIVAMSVVNAMTLKLSVAEILLANGFFIAAVWLMEKTMLSKQLDCKIVKYDKIALITDEKRGELIADLEARLGVKVVRVEVGSVDFLKDSAMLKVYYKDKQGSNTMNDVVKMPRNE